MLESNILWFRSLGKLHSDDALRRHINPSTATTDRNIRLCDLAVVVRNPSVRRRKLHRHPDLHSLRHITTVRKHNDNRAVRVNKRRRRNTVNRPAGLYTMRPRPDKARPHGKGIEDPRALGATARAHINEVASRLSLLNLKAFPEEVSREVRVDEACGELASPDHALVWCARVVPCGGEGRVAGFHAGFGEPGWQVCVYSGGGVTGVHVGCDYVEILVHTGGIEGSRVGFLAVPADGIAACDVQV